MHRILHRVSYIIPYCEYLYVCLQPVSAHYPPPLHVYVRIHHTPPEDGCKLYQPYERKEKGSIGIGLVREMLKALSDTNLGNWLVEGREWFFDHRGPAAGVDCTHVCRIAPDDRVHSLH